MAKHLTDEEMKILMDLTDEEMDFFRWVRGLVRTKEQRKQLIELFVNTYGKHLKAVEKARCSQSMRRYFKTWDKDQEGRIFRTEMKMAQLMKEQAQTTR